MFMLQMFRIIISLLILGLFVFNSTNAYAKRTVKGIITDKNDNPANNVRVKAFDNDPWPNPDDLMGIDMTDSSGYYEIHYEGGHWDYSPSHRWTI